MLSGLKTYLNITYEDPETDKMLTGAIERGMSVLNDYAGVTLDYEKEGLPKQLLFDYCRYVRSHAAEMFEPNFRSDLIALREMSEVKRYADKDTISDI